MALADFSTPIREVANEFEWKNRRGSAYLINNLEHVRLPSFGPIRAALTYQDLSFDTKKPLVKSRVTLPLNIYYKINNWSFRCLLNQR